MSELAGGEVDIQQNFIKLQTIVIYPTNPYETSNKTSSDGNIILKSTRPYNLLNHNSSTFEKPCIVYVLNPI